jgi:Ferredoxin-dependent bilin reductase
MALGFERIAQKLESFLRGELSLSAKEEPRLDGEWRGEPASLASRCYQGPEVRYGRVTIFAARGVEIASLVFFPRLDRKAPILGADLVEHAQGAGLVVADLSPVCEEPDVDPVLSRAAAALPSAGELPPWAARVFSRTPIFGRVADPDRAFDAVRAAAGAFVSRVRASVPQAAFVESVRAAQSRYVRAHREDDRALGLVAKVFGPGPARRYVEEVLFPEVSS